MKIVVTGANGFIGSYLCNFLLNNNYSVIGISRRFHPGVKEILSRAELIEMDVLSPDFQHLKFDADAFVHLAAANDIISKNSIKGIELSVLGTINSLQFCKYNRINKFLFFSTLQVYGTELDGEYNSNSLIIPENDYAINHFFCEQYIEMFSKKNNLSSLVIRPSNVYGPFLTKEINRWTLVPGCFCKEAIENKSITMFSSGRQTRNFISLEQLSYLTLKSIENIHKSFDTLNFASEKYMTISEMAFLVSKILKEHFNIIINPNINTNIPEKSNTFHITHDKYDEYEIDQTYLSEMGTLDNNIIDLINLLLKSN